MLLGYLAYDGALYHGFAKQRGVSTIEGVLRSVIEPLGLKLLKYASRTDKGVHALSQLLLFKSDANIRDVRELIIMLNSKLPDCMVLYGYAVVHSENADLHSLIKYKEYLYIAPDFGEDPDLIERAIAYLNAKEHDFSALSKRARERERYVRRIKVEYNTKGDFQYFKFRSKGFLWEQVRRTVTAIKALALGRLSFNAFVDLLNGKPLKTGIAPAPPECLILFRIVTRLNKWRFIIERKVLEEIIKRKVEIYTASLSKSWVLSR